MNFKRKQKRTTKLLNWGSPKELQNNREPRRVNKVKPKKYCKKLKGPHKLEDYKIEMHYFGSTDASGRYGWRTTEKRCIACGHKEFKFETVRGQRL